MRKWKRGKETGRAGMTVAEIVQIVLGSLSLVATVAVSFFIYWLQHRHEKEMERVEEKRRQEELKEEAHRFLIDNADEEWYLPWCVIATNLHRHASHVRAIYTNFNRCSIELQNTILDIAGYSIRTIDGTDWVDKSFERLEADIEKYRLGEQPFLYDDAKYFHRSFEEYKEIEYKKSYDTIFKTIYKQSPRFILNKKELDNVDLNSYIKQYFDYVLDADKKLSGLEWDDPIPPVDYVWDGCELCNLDEDFVCFWVMELVGNFIINIHNREKTIDVDNLLMDNATDAFAETYEDRYYEILLWMYFTYGYQNTKSEMNKPKNKIERKSSRKKSGLKRRIIHVKKAQYEISHKS